MPDNGAIQTFQPRQRLGAGDLNAIGSFINETGKEFNERDRLPDNRLSQINAGNILISAAETGKGKYTAKLLPYAVKNIDPTADISATEIGSSGEDVLALNPGEIGGVSSPIDVTSGAVYAFGHLTDSMATDNRRVVIILTLPSTGYQRFQYITDPDDSTQKLFQGSKKKTGDDSWDTLLTFDICSDDGG